MGMVSDGKNLYIADVWNNVIRKLVIATGEVTTFAGKARSSGYKDAVGHQARFFAPDVITFVGGKLYVADYNTIRSINITTGKVVTIAGTFSVPAGDPVDGIGAEAHFGNIASITTDGTNLFVIDVASSNVRKIDIVTHEVTTLDFLAGLLFYKGTSLTSDGANLYLVSSGIEELVYKFEIATGTVTSVAGPWGYAYDGGANWSKIAGIVKQNEFVYVADTSGAIRRINIDTGDELVLAGTAGKFAYRDGTGDQALFRSPAGLVIDGKYLYVSDMLSHNIRQIDIESGEVSTLAGSGPGDTDGIGAEARFFEPYDVTSDGTNLYVVDHLNATIRQISLVTGMVSTLAGKALNKDIVDGIGEAARFVQPHSITNDGTYLYVTDFGTIRKIEISSGMVTTLAGQPTSGYSTDGNSVDARFSYPYGVTTDGIYLYVAEEGSSTIRKVHCVTGEVTTLAGTAFSVGNVNDIGKNARFDKPTDITIDGTSLYVADSGNYAIRKIDIDSGLVSAFFDSTMLSDNRSYFFNPKGITKSGDFLFVDIQHAVLRISLETASAIFIAGGMNDYRDGPGDQALFNLPQGITSVGNDLYVADTANHVIRRIENVGLP